jgi:nucleotide-binding universal stress UspA family protein
MGTDERSHIRLVKAAEPRPHQKTILLAYNQTSDSDRALQRAAELAGFYGARIVVTSVVPVMVGGAVSDTRQARELHRAGARLEELGHQVELVEAVGDIAEAIVEVSLRYDADLIVVGTRELGSIERLLGHSVSESVQRMARCDVLIVH